MKTNHFIKAAAVFLALAGISVAAMAQNQTVKGTVVEKTSDGEAPMAGVFVKVHDRNIGTTTDLEGKYSIEVPSGTVLEFSFMGYETISEAVGQKIRVVTVSSHKSCIFAR